jgi:hypothetical protein
LFTAGCATRLWSKIFNASDDSKHVDARSRH